MLKIIERENIGRARYVVDFFTGKTLGDGSEFYDMRIFSNRKVKDKFVKALRAGETNKARYARCIHCDCWIDPAFGADSPAEHTGNEGTEEDPRAPGDFDNICDVCNYDKHLRGGPHRNTCD